MTLCVLCELERQRARGKNHTKANFGSSVKLWLKAFGVIHKRFIYFEVIGILIGDAFNRKTIEAQYGRIGAG